MLIHYFSMADNLCYRCGKAVYYAERYTVLSKHWHRSCFRCTECQKILTPGHFAEHSGLPYCNKPCYQALFGPTISGYGIGAVAHNKFGSSEQHVNSESTLQRREMLDRVQCFNSRSPSESSRLKCKEVNGRIVLEGLLRVYWRVNRKLNLANDQQEVAETESEQDLNRQPSKVKYYAVLPENPPGKQSSSRFQTLPGRVKTVELDSEDTSLDAPVELRNKPLDPKVLRGTLTLSRSRHRQSVNGYVFRGPSTLKPPADVSTVVRVSSEEQTRHVIEILLRKFKVEESRRGFALFMITADGSEYRLTRNESPLLKRLSHGPLETDAKLVLREKEFGQEMTEEIRHLASLPNTLLQQMLDLLDAEEAKEREQICQRYERMREQINEKISATEQTTHI